MTNYQSKVYLEQGASAIVLASGGSIRVESGGAVAVASGGTLSVAAGGTITGLGAAGVLPGNLASGTIPLGAHLWSARLVGASGESIATGAVHLTSSGTVSLELTATNDPSGYINWASNVVTAIKLPPVAMPADLSVGTAAAIDVMGESVGTGTASDAKSCFDIRCWAGIGDTEMGATHPDFTSTPSWKSITIASGNLTTDTLNISLVPQAHAGRPIRLYDMRLRYTRTS